MEIQNNTEITDIPKQEKKKPITKKNTFRAAKIIDNTIIISMEYLLFPRKVWNSCEEIPNNFSFCNGIAIPMIEPMKNVADETNSHNIAIASGLFQ